MVNVSYCARIDFYPNIVSSWRTERIHQQYRDDVVNRVRTELMLENNAQVEQLVTKHQQEVQQLQ